MEGNNNGIFYLTSYNNKFNEKTKINTNNTKNQIKTKNNQININNKKISPKKLIINKKNNNDLKLGTDIKHVSPEHINNYIFPEHIKTIINAKQNLPQNIWIINNFLNSKDNINNISNEDVKVSNTHYNYYKKNNQNSYKINVLDSNDNITNLRNNKSKDSHIDTKRYVNTDYNIYKKGNKNYINNNIYNRNNFKNNYNFTNDNSNIKTIELNKNINCIKTEENIEKSDININKLMNRKKFKEEDQLINKINTDILIKNCQKLLANKEKDKNNKICKTSRNTNDINLDKIDEPKIEKENDLLQMGTIRIPKGIKNNTTKNSMINIKIDQNKKREDLFNKYTNAKAISKLKGDYTFESLLGANLDTIQNLNYDNYYNSLIDDFVLNDKMNNINYNNINNNNNNINIEDNNSTYLDILSALKENNYIKIKKKPIINNEVDNIQKNKIDKNQIMLSENIDTNIDEQNDNNINGNIKKIKLKLGRISNQNKVNDNYDISNYNNYYTNNNTKKNNRIISNVLDRINNNIIYQSNINNINLNSGGRNTPYRKKTPINRSVDSNNRRINIKTNIKTISQISPRNYIKIKNNQNNKNINNNIIVYLKKTKEIKSSISCTNIFKNKNNINK